MYKEFGARWKTIAQYLYRRDENDTKNKFYATLKRVATRAKLEDPIRFNGGQANGKKYLIQFVDLALQYSHQLPAKKGRKRNAEKIKAYTERILFPRFQSSTQSHLKENSQSTYCQQPHDFNLPQAPMQYLLIPCYQFNPEPMIMQPYFIFP